jgi:hypothetical protein
MRSGSSLQDIIKTLISRLYKRIVSLSQAAREEARDSRARGEKNDLGGCQDAVQSVRKSHALLHSLYRP